jgi:hypothetical protein
MIGENSYNWKVKRNFIWIDEAMVNQPFVAKQSQGHILLERASKSQH